MEKTQKRKITVDIAGLPLTLITDECDSFVDAVVSQVNERMASASHSIRSSSRMGSICAPHGRSLPPCRKSSTRRPGKPTRIPMPSRRTRPPRMGSPD